MAKEPVLYEAMYILDSALDDSAIQTIVQTLEEQVRTLGGEVVATREFGRRRLAFEIEGHTNGTYMIMYFNSHGSVVDELRHEMHLMEGLIRGIIVLPNPKAIFEPQPPAEAPALEEAAVAAEPDMALAEATTPAVSVGEAVAESEAEAVIAAEEAVAEEAPVEAAVTEETPVQEAEAAPAEAEAAEETEVEAEAGEAAATAEPAEEEA